MGKRCWWNSLQYYFCVIESCFISQYFFFLPPFACYFFFFYSVCALFICSHHRWWCSAIHALVLSVHAIVDYEKWHALFRFSPVSLLPNPNGHGHGHPQKLTIIVSSQFVDRSFSRRFYCCCFVCTFFLFFLLLLRCATGNIFAHLAATQLYHFTLFISHYCNWKQKKKMQVAFCTLILRMHIHEQTGTVRAHVFRMWICPHLVLLSLGLCV